MLPQNLIGVLGFLACATLLGNMAVARGGPAVARDNAYVVGISGMTWLATCPDKVREALKTVKDVRYVEIDFNAKTATVTMKGSATLAQSDVEAAFKGTKFGVTSVKRR